MNDTAKDITEVCNEIRDLLIAKNKAYGDSALNPVRIFSHADIQEQIRVRLDDKLSRLRSGNEKAFGEDVELDIMGYLILLRIAKRRQKETGGTRIASAEELAVGVLKRVELERRFHASDATKSED